MGVYSIRWRFFTENKAILRGYFSSLIVRVAVLRTGIVTQIAFAFIAVTYDDGRRHRV
jgi:hypothetical protein